MEPRSVPLRRYCRNNPAWVLIIVALPWAFRVAEAGRCKPNPVPMRSAAAHFFPLAMAMKLSIIAPSRSTAPQGYTISSFSFTYISSRCQHHWRKPRVRLTRRRRTSPATIGPNRFHYTRCVANADPALTRVPCFVCQMRVSSPPYAMATGLNRTHMHVRVAAHRPAAPWSPDLLRKSHFI